MTKPPSTAASHQLTRRVVCASLAGGATAVLAACAGRGGSGASPAGVTGSPAATGEVSVLYYTSTQPAYQRMEKQEAAIKTLLPQIKLNMIATETSPSQKFVTMAAGDTAPDIVWLGVASGGSRRRATSSP